MRINEDLISNINGNITVGGISSKNMFNKNSIILNKALNSSGAEITASGYFVSDYMEVEANKPYTSQGFNSNFKAWYTSDKTFISSSSTATATSPSNAKYCRMNGEIASSTNMQLEKGSTATTYSEYQGMGRTDIVTGVECPTNEYIDGKQVFIKKFNLGALNLTGSYQFIGTDFLHANINIDKYFAQAKNQTNSNQRINLPVYIGGEGWCSVTTGTVDGNVCFIVAGQAGFLSGFNLLIELHYTKN